MSAVPPDPPHDAIETQLARILKGEGFASAERLKKLLTYLVRQYLNDANVQLKEYTVAVDVFERKDFDPGRYSVVRGTAKRLRKELEQYYANSGKDDPILIELPKGHYVPQFSFRERTNKTPAAVEARLEPGPSETPADDRKYFRIALWCAAGLFVAAVVGLGLARSGGRPVPDNPEEDTRPRRLLSRSTSEGQSPLRIKTGQIHGQLLVTPNGRKLYAFSPPDQRAVTVLSLVDLTVMRTFDLPRPLYDAVMSRNGKHIYISAYSPAEEVMVLDTDSGRVDMIPTGGPAFGIAVTPDETKLFMAMGSGGLKRINLKTHEIRVVSALSCPFHLALDPAGRRLYVGYQCGGPGGSPGHDAVDVYDVDSEESIDIIKGLPLVGGDLSVSPRGDLVLFDGQNACSSPEYDHVGCPETASRIFHLWNVSGRRPITPAPIRQGGTAAFVPQGSRILFLDNDLLVWDWARRSIIERVSLPGASFIGVAFTPRGDRAFASDGKSPGLLVLEQEKDECLPPSQGLANFYSGDGTFGDSQGGGLLTSTRPPQFSPGRVGQALHFNGQDNFLLANGGGDFCPFCDQSLTESLFLKLDSTAGEMTVLERLQGAHGKGRRIYKGTDNHIVYDAGDAKASISSMARVEPGKWYHLAVVTEKDHVSFYVDGVLQGRRETNENPFIDAKTSVFLGASAAKRNFLAGLIDELAVYNRALAPDEVKTLAHACSAEK
ncbi:MAG TPA: LamG-like jellyroll fold domain-containing protein [Bryobacteraceae bacterium]